MQTITLSGANFGGMTITGNFTEGEDVVVTDGTTQLRYRIEGEQAVYQGGVPEGTDTSASVYQAM